MPRRPTKKGLADTEAQQAKSTYNQDSTNEPESQGLEDDRELSESETQLYQEDEQNYKKPTNQAKARHFCFIVYPESAPSDWKEQMDATGLSWACSPLHDKDKNPDGSPKKEHYHGIVSYANTTTYNAVASSIRTITHGPYPQVCGSVGGAYAYFTHKHNPEKEPYEEADIERRNGWTKVLESTEVRVLMDELTMMVLMQDCQEYAELIIEAKYSCNPDAYEVVMSHTLYFDKLITSYRHSPIRTLKRWYNYIDDEETKQMIAERIRYIDLQQESEEQ